MQAVSRESQKRYSSREELLNVFFWRGDSHVSLS